tara:strand:- start:59 stop:502 length:444 start_codon:yes stop_codon:yes gene_type:complete
MVNYRELLCQCHGRAYAQRFHDDFMKQLDTLSAVRNSVVKDVMRRGTVAANMRDELRSQPEAMLFERLKEACESASRSQEVYAPEVYAENSERGRLARCEKYTRAVRPLAFDISAMRIQRAWKGLLVRRLEEAGSLALAGGALYAGK